MKVYFLSKVDGSKSAINEGPLQEKANQLLPNQKLAASAERQIRIAKLHQDDARKLCNHASRDKSRQNGAAHV